MTAGELWLILLGFIIALVVFFVVALLAKAIAEMKSKSEHCSPCDLVEPCDMCVCYRRFGG